MSLKISLKPGERLIIGGAVVSNGNTKCELTIENNVPIMRQKDILRERDANTPCKRIYFVIQLMYVDNGNLAEKHDLYWRLAKDVAEAAPSTAGLIAQMSDHIVNGKHYQALKLAKKLIAYEEEAVAHAKTGT